MSRPGWFFLAGVLIVLAACSSDKGSPRVVDPATPFPAGLPPQGSMQVDFADIAYPTREVSHSGPCRAGTAFLVDWIRLNLERRLLLPEAVLAACSRQTPAYLGDQEWRWVATGGQGDRGWSAELTATVSLTPEGLVDHVYWEMRVTGSELALSRALWVKGISGSNGLVGAWSCFDPTVSPNLKQVLACTWDLTSAVSLDRHLVFYVTDPDAAGYGDRARYVLADSVVTLDQFDASAGATVRVSWDLRDGAGWYDSAAGWKCCWGSRDAHYPNVLCP
jgi:hypothetical protein